MTLERCQIKKQKADCIQQSLHRVYGLVWTDGHSVFLSSVVYDKEHLQTAYSRKLGQFELPIGFHIKSIMRVNEGCHLLALESRDGTTKDIIELRSATCGCWSLDGMKLILANKSMILELIFDRKHNMIDKKESSVEGITGTFLCLRAFYENLYGCTVEPSLQQICYSGDLFRAPEFNSSSDGFGRRALQPQSAHTSEIVLLCVSSDGSPPIVIDKTLVPGITGLDLLLVTPETGTIVTGNGASNTSYLYNVVEHKLLNKVEISLEQDERPRGMYLATSPKLSEDVLVAIVKNSE